MIILIHLIVNIMKKKYKCVTRKAFAFQFHVNIALNVERSAKGKLKNSASRKICLKNRKILESFQRMALWSALL